MEAVSTSETSVSFYQTYMEQCPRRQAIFRFEKLFIAVVRNGGWIVGKVFIGPIFSYVLSSTGEFWVPILFRITILMVKQD
jgi:hypothetical protein